jgi:hypothetical protein
MGFTIETYNLLGVQISNLYVSIHGGFNVTKPSYYVSPQSYDVSPQSYDVSPTNSLPAFQVTYSYTMGIQGKQPISVQCGVLNLSTLPVDSNNLVNFYSAIYHNIKLALDPNYGSSEPVLKFTDV